jgi:hypothetical protein
VLLVVGELVSGRLFSYDTSVAPTAEEVVVSLSLVAPLAVGRLLACGPGVLRRRLTSRRRISATRPRGL